MSEHVGLVIKRLREDRKLSKSRLSREAGVSDAYIVQIEKGDRSPSEDVLRRLARVLRVPPHTLLIPAGRYSPEEIQDAEHSAMDQCYEIERGRPDLDLPDDLFDRYMAREFELIDYRRDLTPDGCRLADSELAEMALPSELYWGWNKPLGVMPPENWDTLSDADRRLAQKLINRMASDEDTEA